MRIDPIHLQNKSQLINDYQHQKQKIMDHFDYAPFQGYEQRIIDINNREYKRDQLSELLYTVNKRWNAPQSTLTNIERLKHEDSVVVIGGQQAGLMTGPLYAVNKVISIIQLARQQEEILNIPVIPVFWIAGEDHDYDEINHVFFMKEQSLKKHILAQQVSEKQSITHIDINRAEAEKWLNELFEQLNETSYTKDIYTTVKSCLNQSNTYVDFFARLIFQLFQEQGLVLVDSASPEMREIETDYFIQLIENQPDIAEGVYTAFQELSQTGYSISLDVGLNDGHLFIYENKERVLLERNAAGEWVGKQDEIKLTTEQLLEIAKYSPTRLSNNVVSRPIMQEFVFPSLAFIGGLGEISYWAVLKPAFHALGLKMPPVIPRLSLTFIDRKIEKKLKKFAIDGSFAVNHGVEERKGNWLAAQNNPPLGHMLEQIKQAIDDAHRPLRKVAEGIRADLGELANKNLEVLFRDIDFLQERIYKVVEDKFAEQLADFNLIQQTLYPNNGLQERIWNPLQLINDHGLRFIEQLTNEYCSFEADHYLVYME
jgi:bacillithiol biosynthesis cysteine-adding enzyme BshC